MSLLIISISYIYHNYLMFYLWLEILYTKAR